jgi:capsular polysaccharide biosynthesis protein
VELQEYLRTLRKRWKTVAVTAALTILLALGATLAFPKVYVSDAKLFVSTSSSSDVSNILTGAQFSGQRVKTYTQLVKTPQVLAPVSAYLGYELGKGQVTATSPLDTVLINIAVTSDDPTKAVAGANAVASQLAQVIQELETPLTSGQPSPVKATVVQSASVPLGPDSPKPLRNLALGILLGALLGLGLAILQEVLDNSVKSFDDVLAATGSNPIAVIG